MLKIHSEPPEPDLSNTRWVLFSLGFRPFFSAAAISAVLLILCWLPIWTGGIWASAYYGVIGWHSHEMLFGYAAAVIAGFLLTAVRNWTGINTPSGVRLALLAALWLGGRLAPAFDTLLPGPVIAVIDLAFLPSLAIAILPPLWRGKQKINLIFVPLLLLMFVANLLVHLQCLGLSETATQGIDMMLYLVLFLIALVGGRVIPFFSKAVIPGYSASVHGWVEKSSFAAFGVLPLLPLTGLPTQATGLTASVLALLQIIRVGGWHHRRVWRTPILWVLYTGMLWIIIGLLLTGLSSFGVLPATLSKHALTIGGIGVLTLGMMARVSLGHTGRRLQPARAVEIAFILLNAGALCRVFGPLVQGDSYIFWVHLAGGFWIISFLIFSFYYLPMLFRPREDGRPG